MEKPVKRSLLIGGGVGAAAIAGIIVFGLTQGANAQAPAAATPNAPAAAAHPRGEHHRGHGPFHLAKGEHLVIGSVASADGGKLVINTDGGGQQTLTTDKSTKVRGQGVKSLSDLKAGERVIAKAKDGKALGVLVPRGHAAGTITSVNGDQAVLEQPDGLVLNLDLSGVSDKPKQGDIVAVTGTATDGGKTLKVTTVHEIPAK